MHWHCFFLKHNHACMYALMHTHARLAKHKQTRVHMNMREGTIKHKYLDSILPGALQATRKLTNEHMHTYTSTSTNASTLTPRKCNYTLSKHFTPHGNTHKHEQTNTYNEPCSRSRRTNTITSGQVSPFSTFSRDKSLPYAYRRRY